MNEEEGGKMMRETLLMVDDEIGIIQMMKRLLEKEGFEGILEATSGEEALEKIRKHPVDLILLDVMLPDTDGFRLCQQIREMTDVPILFLTARTADMDKLTGFSMGGDDYITKPFNPLEVVARIKAILHRQRRLNSRLREFRTGHFVLYLEQAKLVVDGKEVKCPAKEFELLKFLCEHPNQVFSVDSLYQHVWGDYPTVGKENTVMVHIRRLRQKIEKDPKHPEYLKNIRGLGYMLAVSDKERR
ncbi:DNA-binding response OmpR family regulator [Thermoactinomyces vulgaris]|jgi:two-component system, OmpR family, response regulator RegX3|nr:DNA-binding response OmpR family regulator [Thermoactinomyces vulgaris]